MTTKICIDCEREWPLDRFRADNAWPDSCFRCRSAGVSLTVQGGRDYFRDDTERNRAAKALSEARAAGFDPVPSETKGSWSAASAPALAKIGSISKKNGAFGKKAPTSSAPVAGTTTKSTTGAAL